MKRVWSTLFFVLLIAIISCSKGGGTATEEDSHVFTPGDTTTPIVILNTPTDNQLFANGDIIKVDGKVTDNSLYRGSIKITDDANGAIIKEQLYEIHGLESYNFTVEYKSTVTTVANYTVTIRFEDHGLNAGVSFVKVKVNP